MCPAKQWLSQNLDLLFWVQSLHCLSRTLLFKWTKYPNWISQQLSKDKSSLWPHLPSPGNQKQNPGNQNRISESRAGCDLEIIWWEVICPKTQQDGGRLKVRTSNSKLNALHSEFTISILPPFPGQELSVQGPRLDLPRAMASKLFWL